MDAPIIEELPLALECTLVSYDETRHHMIGKVVNVCADESILGEDGEIDVVKLEAITYDPVHRTYVKLGERVGKAFGDGAVLK